ncbi:MAG: TolC family protein [Proteobacteria bacterium]|nr:TolC family protein [Pseudomonadota bacterium]
MKETSVRAASRLTVLLVLPLAGCATYRARPIHPAASARALATRSLTDPRLLRFLAVEEHRAGPPRWNLDTLTLVATYERPDMPLATAQLGEARAVEITAAELPNPTLSFRPTYNTTTTVPSPWKVGPIVTFLIRPFRVRPALIARAQAQAQAARESIAATAWQLRGRVRAALLALWSAQRAAGLSRRALAVASRYEGAVALRYRAGMVSAATLTMATLGQEQAQLAAAAGERTLRLSCTGLATALGLPIAALQEVRLDLAGISHPRRPGKLGPLIQAALVTRPEVLAALARYRASEANLRLAIARQYPSIDIGPGYHYDQGDNKFILAVSLSLPILNQNQGSIAQARAARRIAAAQFRATQAEVLGEIERAQTDWIASEAELASARQVRASAASALSRRRIEFAAGQIGQLRLLGAEEASVEAEQGALAASVHERVALGDLEAALYHPFLIAAGTR